VTRAAAPGQIVPVDSEHSALAQCLRGGRAEEVDRLVLTASGGPFRGRRRDELAHVGLDDALKHPTWDMGPVVTINSATLVNKGLELIEAHLLFGVPYDRIDVVVTAVGDPLHGHLHRTADDRPGQSRAGPCGSFAQGAAMGPASALAWAIVAPSVKVTMEWITDCGCTTTSIRS